MNKIRVIEQSVACQSIGAWSLVPPNTGTVVVAVIDTGIDYTHPDLIANLDTADGWNFITNTSNARDDFFHGTHCAGTIGGVGNNGVGVAGVCWQVTIVPLKFLDSSGSGTTPGRVFKGRKMPGRLGGGLVTVKSLIVVQVIPEKNLLLLKGAVPGKSGNLLLIRKSA